MFRINESKNTINIFKGYSVEDSLIKESSSGAIFFELALLFYYSGDYVVGAVYLDDYSGVKHVVTNDIEVIKRMRGSKYVQSNMKGVFSEMDEVLTAGRRILFSGTPCQCKIVRDKYGDNQQILCVEVICNGVMRPDVFKRGMERLKRQVGSSPVLYTMRHKKDGHYPIFMKAIFENGREIIVPFYKTELGMIYGCRIALAQRCYRCRCKGFPRAGDITIGDYHRFQITNSIQGGGMGASTVVINSERGCELIDVLKKNGRCVFIAAKSFKEAVEDNPRLMIIGYSPSRNRREIFIKKYMAELEFDVKKELKCYFSRLHSYYRKTIDYVELKKEI